LNTSVPGAHDILVNQGVCFSINKEGQTVKFITAGQVSQNIVFVDGDSLVCVAEERPLLVKTREVSKIQIDLLTDQ
jgi:hypothetical protein